MLHGNYWGEHLTCGSGAWKYWYERRAGTITAKEWTGVEARIARLYCHCMAASTHWTTTGIAKELGLILRGSSSVPAPNAGHIRLSSTTGLAQSR